MLIPFCLLLLFKVTGVDGVGVGPAAIRIPPTPPFVFFLLLPLLLALLFPLFGWHVSLLLILSLLLRTHGPVKTEDYEALMSVDGSQAAHSLFHTIGDSCIQPSPETYISILFIFLFTEWFIQCFVP